MNIDFVSEQIVKIALYLENKVPGYVSEIWIDEEIVDKLKSPLPNDQEIEQLVKATAIKISELDDKRRKKYLSEILHSLEYQISILNRDDVFYHDFTQQTFGFPIERVHEDELKQIELKLLELEKKIGLSRQEIYRKHSLSLHEYANSFKHFVQKAKTILPTFVSDFPDEGFLFDVITNKPWSAFNSHIAPFKSRLTLNTDITFTKLDLYRLAFHEAYGGHHSELSHKDLLLIKQGRGEHGLVITFSPQTFVSEAIAEGIYVILGGLEEREDDRMISWYYDRLTFALQNAATFWFFDDHFSRSKIHEKLCQYSVEDKTVENILNFSTDKLFGKYAPVYYSAFNFIQDIYENTNKKDQLIRTLFIEPCTPNLLIQEFGKN